MRRSWEAFDTLQNFKSLFFGGYQKLPKPFSCATTSIMNHQNDQCYADFCNEWCCDLEKTTKRKKNGMSLSKELAREEEGRNESSLKLPSSPLKKKEDGIKEEKSMKHSNSRREEKCIDKKDEGGYVLAKKMKELEMMDGSDMEHMLDVEEALHYYSHLRSPAYVDIVDKFFTDM
uniref:OVATE domain-containing protein n=1 Tax=Manihot esculenta TaxID=3983 RepID=A0A2C9UYH8_MANES